ncbi:hypothetical protein PR048_016231 [Dryococelus australis]|uniref:Uncharacterized protein n=1 Tax=Dryococelus australis TaxID=614101 RepID=A0ABQ9HJ58_9NEOP|nr:hypothetical protein PR048_016231 [Dryococelus australis]
MHDTKARSGSFAEKRAALKVIQYLPEEHEELIDRSGVVVRLLASRKRRTVFDSRWGRSRIFGCVNSARRFTRLSGAIAGMATTVTPGEQERTRRKPALKSRRIRDDCDKCPSAGDARLCPLYRHIPPETEVSRDLQPITSEQLALLIFVWQRHVTHLRNFLLVVPEHRTYIVERKVVRRLHYSPPTLANLPGLQLVDFLDDLPLFHHCIPLLFRVRFLSSSPALTISTFNPTKANRVRSPAGSLPDFRKWESSRTILLVGGFPHGPPVYPAFALRVPPYPPLFTLTGFHDLALRNSTNRSTHLLHY